MATDLIAYVPVKPGLESSQRVHDRLEISDVEGLFGHFGANHFARQAQKVNLIAIGGINGYQSGTVTQTRDNSETTAILAAGLTYTTNASPADNNDMADTGLRAVAMAADKWHVMAARIKVSSAANLGLTMGIVTSSATEIASANPADGVFIIKAKNAATLTGRVVENTNAAVDVTSFRTASSTGAAVSMADATDMELGIAFKAGTTAAKAAGYWYINGYITPFSADQRTALHAMLNTTAPTLAAQLGFRVNGTTQRTAVVQFCEAEVDR